MEKYLIFGAGILIILGLIIVLITANLQLTSLSTYPPETIPKTQNSHAWTKAICDKDNLCQDYLIECNGQNPVKLSPITGASIQFDKTWQDPRSLEQRERLCD